MDTVLWIIQALMAFAFVAAGSMKVISSKEKLLENPRMAWTNDFTPTQLKTIGGLEVAGGLGLVLPAVLDILVFLTPLAAIGLTITMIGAAYTHIRRNEMDALPINAILGGLVAFIAVGRLFIEPFA